MQSWGKGLPCLAVKITELTHQYHQQSQSKIQVKDWQVKQGQSVFLHGHSGSGKSTLLNLLSGILSPNSGTIEIFGYCTSKLTRSQKDKFRAEHIGVVFQTFNLVPYLSVLENIKLASYFANNRRDIAPEASQLLKQLGLAEPLLHKSVDQLSIGQQQRVAIARALINQPKLLLVDEPTSALDAQARDDFMTLLVSIAKQNQMCLIFVSHDQSLDKYFDVKTHIQSILTTETLT